MKALRQNLLVQFSAIALVVVAIVTFASTWWMKVNMEDMILRDASSQAVDTVSRLVSPQLTSGDFQEPMLGERYEAFNDYVERYIVSDRIARIKLWNPEGQVIFSTDRSQVGRSFDIKEPLAQALDGGIGQDISIPQAAENERERVMGTLIETYAPVLTQDSEAVVGAFEIYQFFAPFARNINQHNRNLYISMISSGLVLYLALFVIVRKAWHTILLQTKEVDTRLREVQGLNNLFQQHLAERDYAIESLRNLSAEQVQVGALSKEELITEYHNLKTEIQRLTEHISRSPLMDGIGS